jgi:hypothetical protein
VTSGGDALQAEVLALDLSRAELSQALQRGFSVIRSEFLLALGVTYNRLAVPEGLSERQAVALLEGLYGADRVDFNHAYRITQANCKGERCTTRQIVNWKDEQSLRCRIETRIGIIDTGVSAVRSGVPTARLTTRRFHGNPDRSDPAHGSAIAALLAGSEHAVPGLLPYARLYAADVFGQRKDGSPVSSATFIAEAVDWLVRQRVQVINISVAGPDNALLKAAIGKAVARGVTVVASAGNDGPRARPAYPAAYPGVIAVTAVDARRRLYPLANRGAYVALAAPGVAVYAPTADGGGYHTGTSFASPFVAASAAVLRARGVTAPGEVLKGLQRSAIDLGARGRDPLYGWGLLRAPAKCP